MQKKLSLIIDSGATKAEWKILQPNTESVFSTGLQPYLQTQEQMFDILDYELKDKLPVNEIENVYFYGAGCALPTRAEKVVRVLSDFFKKSVIYVWSDMLGAARALCLNKSGIACTLGTGSNAVYYDGEKIAIEKPGLGYVLGDEGSGSQLGKIILQYYLYKYFDADLLQAFDKKFTTDKETILTYVYRRENVSRYLASFCSFLLDHRGHPQIEKIIKAELNNFFQTHLKKFEEAQTNAVSFTGSVAFFFQDVLKELCTEYNFTLGKVIKNPMQGLVEFHKLQNDN